MMNVPVENDLSGVNLLRLRPDIVPKRQPGREKFRLQACSIRFTLS